MKITVLDGYTLNPGDNPWSPVEQLGELTVYDRTPASEIVNRAQGAEIILTNKVPLSAETLAQLPDLKYIGVLATGFNIIDTAAARERGIIVTNVPAYSTDAVAEHVMGFVLNHYRAQALHSQEVLSGSWQTCPDFSFWKTPLHELAGKTMGIVGFGTIGQRVGEMAAAFHMDILANSRSRSATVPYAFSWASVEEIFASSDIVTLHCPQTPETTGLVNRRMLETMKPSSYLINTARGGLIVEEDLAAVLHEGRIAGAAVDVASVEPIQPDNPLLGAKNLVVTPHIAWAALEARERLMGITAENIRAFQSGKPVNVVNPG